MTVLVDHGTPTAHRPSPDGIACDGLPRQAAGPRFQFRQPNPAGVPGRTYAQSLFAELPYLVGVLVRAELCITEQQWDGLVVTGGVLDVTGPWEYRVPFTLDVIASPPDRAGRAPDGVCEDCWGTSWEIDSDGTMSGVVGGLFRCFCSGAWI